MARLDPGNRARLPDSAFAYIDSRGRRRLPINDEAHVRNALARFNQVAFESDDARERARKRLLRAAKKYGIVPIGFITAQLELERRMAAERRALQGELRRGELHATSTDAATLPSGFVTILMTDIEGSTGLLRRLGDRYRDLLRDVRDIQRETVARARGREIDARGDEFFAVFQSARDAITAATAFQRTLAEHAWPENLPVRVRAGIHSGEPTLTDVGYIGIAIHMAARVCSAAHGGQIIVSGDTRDACAQAMPPGIRFQSLGRHHLHGLPEPAPLFQVRAEGLPARFPPPRTKGRRTRRANPRTPEPS